MADTEESKMEKINELILDISKGASFSSSAMQQFVELQSEVDSQESTIRYLRSEREKDKDKIGDLNSNMRGMEGHIEALETEKASFHARIGEIEARERLCLEHELRAEYSSLRVEDHQTMVGLIFRNTELRKTSFGQELTHQPGSPEMKDQYGNVQQYHTPAGFEATPVKKDEVETKE